MHAHPEPRVVADCPKCYGTLIFPTPWVGYHAYRVDCDCEPAAELARRRGRSPGDLWGGTVHRQRLICTTGRIAWMDDDDALVADVQRLWEAGIWTWVSCQGYGDQPRSVGLSHPSQVSAAWPLLSWVVKVDEERGFLSGTARLRG